MTVPFQLTSLKILFFKLVSLKLAPRRYTSTKLAFCKSAFSKFALNNKANLKLAFCKLTPYKLAPVKLAEHRSILFCCVLVRLNCEMLAKLLSERPLLFSTAPANMALRKLAERKFAP